MKRSHIISIIVVAIIVGIIFANYTSATKSVSFDRVTEEPGTVFKVSGTLFKDEPIVYDPEINPGLTIFHMEDKEGRVEEIHLHKAKPQGLMQSESIDLYVEYRDDEFHSDNMLLKCPSKYNEQNHLIPEE